MTSEPGPSDALTPDSLPSNSASSDSVSPDSASPDSVSPDSVSLKTQSPDPQIDSVAIALDRLNNAAKKAQAEKALVLGQATFERGRYRKAIAYFQRALEFSNPMGASGGEIQLWLVNAYVAAGDNEAGLALCRKLILHPDLETKRQSKRLLYILEAPELEMKPEWVTKIPDLAQLEDGGSNTYAQTPKRPRRRKPKPEPEPIDLSQVNTADNQFVWIALIGIALTLGGLFWFS